MRAFLPTNRFPAQAAPARPAPFHPANRPPDPDLERIERGAFVRRLAVARRRGSQIVMTAWRHRVIAGGGG